MNKPSILCDKCDIYMSCLLDYDGILCRKNRTVEPTNADRIRSMTDEELAKMLPTKSMWNCPPDIKTRGGCPGQCVPCWLDWLKQEVKE